MEAPDHGGLAWDMAGGDAQSFCHLEILASLKCPLPWGSLAQFIRQRSSHSWHLQPQNPDLPLPLKKDHILFSPYDFFPSIIFQE